MNFKEKLGKLGSRKDGKSESPEEDGWLHNISDSLISLLWACANCRLYLFTSTDCYDAVCKSLLLFCFIFIYSSNYAQPFRPTLRPWIRNASAHKLIATNDKQTRRYYEDDVLKICFHQNGAIVKAKGRLLVDSVGFVEINPYGRKPIVLIATDSIVSISRWHHTGKIVSASLAGAGLIFAGLSIAASTPNASALAVILFYVPATFLGAGFIVTTSVVFISEWTSLRSQKKGYHFHVE